MEAQRPLSFLDLYSKPRLAPGRALVAVKEPEVPATLPGEGIRDLEHVPARAIAEATRELLGDVNLRRATPHQIGDLSLDLYAAGLLDFEEYSMLAFQPELHPDFDRTIGALTGEPAAPNRPRDFVNIWKDKVRFQLQHSAEDTTTLERTKRITDVLRYLGSAPIHLHA